MSLDASAPAGPIEVELTLGPLNEHKRRRVSFKFDSKYTTGMSCKLRFVCRVKMPKLEQMTGGRRYYVERGKIDYAEIVDMMAELLRMSVQAEMGLRWHSWRASWDRSIHADSIAARLSFALRTVTGLDFDISDADITFVTR